jgi:hypothetical protein
MLFPSHLPLLMLQLAGISRTLLRWSRVAVPALLVCAYAVSADASPRAARPALRTASRSYKDHASRRAARLRQVLRFGQTHNLCSGRLTLGALERQRAQQAGPVAQRPARAGSLAPTPMRITHGRSADADDEDAAIQDDAAAAHIDGNENVTPAFRALGVLASSYDKRPALGAFSPRSPRGPPRAV